MYIEYRSRSGWSILSALSGVLGFVLSWIPIIGIAFGDILGLVAIVAGIVGLLRPGARGLAIVGIVLGAITVLLKSIPIIRWL
ncbi:MAG: hypothetical protein M1516_00305 [Firmicutes bacterium]|jgi:hypothetical protein|nr:hypothetical protein [Bacillota bacterium]